MNNTEHSGNSRFLYLETPALPLDLYSFHRRVLQDLETIGNVTPLNRTVWVYFFAPSSASDFGNFESWVGQEVIGPLNKEMLKNQIDGFSKMTDLDAGPALSVDLSLGSLDDFCWDVILREEQLFRQNFKGDLAETWRVALPWSERSALEGFQIKLQFFEKVRQN